MKKIISAFIITALIVSCNSVDKNDKSNTETAVIGSASSDSVKEKTSAQLKEINTNEALIATALMAAPEESRSGCTVIGYNMSGEFVTLREGDNEFICLADDPNKAGFSAACYHKDLEPFMARGRELKSQGKSRQEIFDIREEEAKSGKLTMGKSGSTLHIYYGEKSQYDPETADVPGAKYRYVVYLPWATSESTGLPTQPFASNHPWIMDPGTHKAHIMISPKVKQ